MIKSLVFDFDGVLLETAEIKTQAFVRMFESYGPEVVQTVVSHHLLNGGVSRVEKLAYYHRVLLDEPVTQEFLDQRAAQYSNLVLPLVLKAPWVAGAEEFLKAHHRSLLLFVCSGTPQDELRLIVARRGMAAYFQAVFGSPDSKETILKRILSQWALKPAEVVSIGDSLTEYWASRATGVHFIGRGAGTFAGLGLTALEDLTGLEEALARI